MKQEGKNEHEVPKTGHIYDGIEELDHPSPNWFMGLFYAGIAFGLAYLGYYILGEGPSLTEEYRKAKVAEEYAQSEQEAKSGGAKRLSEDELKAFLKDPAKKALGAATFQAKCVSCHGAHAQGGIGPNLTDAYWLHGGKLTEVVSTITTGVLDKGMPPWGALLSAEEIQSLSVYIRTLQDSKPAGAKAPQGILVNTEL